MAMNRQTTRQQGIDRPSAWGPRLPGATLQAVPALFMPVLMLGGIYSGAFTRLRPRPWPWSRVLVGLLIYRSLSLSDVVRCFVEGGAVCASVIAILIFLLVFGKLLALEQIPGHLSSALLSISDNYYVVLLMINVVLLIIGMFLDDISGSILAAVILLPVAKQVGVDPIHFAAIVGTNLGLGNVTPPCAPLLFVAGSVTGLDLHAFLASTSPDADWAPAGGSAGHLRPGAGDAASRASALTPSGGGCGSPPSSLPAVTSGPRGRAHQLWCCVPACRAQAGRTFTWLTRSR